MEFENEVVNCDYCNKEMSIGQAALSVFGIFCNRVCEHNYEAEVLGDNQ
jgi:hypothetical protein